MNKKVFLKFDHFTRKLVNCDSKIKRYGKQSCEILNIIFDKNKKRQYVQDTFNVLFNL